MSNGPLDTTPTITTPASRPGRRLTLVSTTVAAVVAMGSVALPVLADDGDKTEKRAEIRDCLDAADLTPLTRPERGERPDADSRAEHRAALRAALDDCGIELPARGRMPSR